MEFNVDPIFARCLESLAIEIFMKDSEGRYTFIFLARRLPALRWGMNGGSLNLRKQLCAVFSQFET